MNLIEFKNTVKEICDKYAIPTTIEEDKDICINAMNAEKFLKNQ